MKSFQHSQNHEAEPDMHTESGSETELDNLEKDPMTYSNTDPMTDPETDLETDPGIDQEINPQTMPEMDSEAGAETDPDTYPETFPENMPGSNPVFASNRKVFLNRNTIIIL